MVKNETNSHLKEDLLNRLDTVYRMLSNECVKNNGLFKEGYLCGLALDNKIEISCKYKNFNQCNYKKEENESKK